MRDIHLPRFKAKELLIGSFFIVLFSFQSNGQLSFSPAPHFLESTHSTISLMTSDMNNDQQDDIIVLGEGTRIEVHLNNALERSWKKVSGPVVGYCWAGMIGDFNNDGKKEIVTGSQSVPFRIYTYDYETESFILYYQFDETFFIQNMNVVDIDNDGWLDLFLCNDDGTNYTLMNDGSGNLEQATIIDFNTIPASDNSGNYGSVFLDFDLDGDQDLYIAKCRGFADSYDDPRRINQFYINDGNQNFEDQAPQFGVAVGAQSWVADFADLDLDGDNDLIVANHYDDLQVFENINNESFVEVQQESGIGLSNSFWQLSFMDMDNDGYLDVIITADDLYVYLNNGDFSFTPVDLIQNNPIVRDFTVTIGDYNNDGFYDLCTGYGSLNQASTHADSIWLNNGNDNQWIDLVLRGTDSNRDAIGTTVYCYQGDKQQIYQIKGGHSYGILNTTTVHFGLGLEALDSVKIVWPSGNVQLLNDLTVNQKYFVEENGCYGAVLVEQFESYQHCEGDEMELSFPYSNFSQWNQGQMEENISYQSDELLFAEYLVEDCPMDAWKIYPHFYDTTMIFRNELLSDGVYLPCPDELILIEIPADEVIWSNGHEGNSYESTEEEMFTANYKQICQDVQVEYERLNISSGFEILDQTVEYEDGDDVMLEVYSEQTQWFETELETVPFHIGATYLFENVTEDRTVYVEDHISEQYVTTTGLDQPSETAGVPGSNVSPIMFFEVKHPILLNSIDVHADFAGTREIEVYTDEYLLIHEQEFELGVGKTVLTLDIELQPGRYLIKTDEIKNQEYLGSNGPQLYRDVQSEDYYPIVDDKEILELTGNSFSISTAYYAFYNWQFEVAEKYCPPTLRHEITLQSVNALETTSLASIYYNNPTNNVLRMELAGKHDLFIFNTNGVQLEQVEHRDVSEIDVSDWIPGYYIIRVQHQSYPLIITD